MKHSASELELEENQAIKRRKLNEEDETNTSEESDAQLPQLLAKETWLRILSGRNIMLVDTIDYRNIWNFRGVNKYFKQLIDGATELEWAQQYFSDFGGITDEIKHSSKSWKQIHLDARSALEKVVEELKLGEIAKVLENNDDLTIEKAKQDNESFWNLLDENEGECEDHEIYQKLATFICKHKHINMVPHYLGHWQKGNIHMEVFYMLFEEKFYNLWQNYMDENDFDQMDLVSLIYEDYVGAKETGYKIENLLRVLDMADKSATVGARLGRYWFKNEEKLRAEIEKAYPGKDIFERIEDIIKKY